MPRIRGAAMIGTSMSGVPQGVPLEDLAILHERPPWPIDPVRRLPGMAPVPLDEWLICDEARPAQMALRDHLLATRRDEVLALRPAAEAAAEELLEVVLAEGRGWPGEVRPDGPAATCDVPLDPPDRAAAIDRDDPLATLGRLLQQDLCLLVRGAGGEHVLEGAVLCFPASWSLTEKLGRPLSAIHGPVDEYDATLARRVQRLCDLLRPEQPLMRHNLLWYERPGLFQPASEAAPRRPAGVRRYLRSERQVLRRLPRTGAVVFAIHTCVVDWTRQRGAAMRGQARAAPLDDGQSG